MNETYCRLLFTGLELTTSGRAKPCCLWNRHIQSPNGNDYVLDNKDQIVDIFQSEDMNNIRQRSLGGEIISECDECFQEERGGAKSRRLRENEKGYVETPILTHLDVKLGNMCNLKCRICNPEHSSLFNSENTQLKLHTIDKTFNYTWNSRLPVWDEIQSIGDNLTSIDFMGGEPMLDRNHINLLMRLINDDAAKNIDITYVTNGTVTNQAVIDLFNEFKSVTIVLSADGIKECYEYNRFPAKWSDFETNFIMYNECNVNLLISYSVSIYSLFGIFDSLDYFTAHGIPVWFNFVFNYDSDISILPEYVKNRFIAIAEHRDKSSYHLTNGIDIDNIIRFMNRTPHNERSWNDFIHITKCRDAIRNQNTFEIISELKNEFIL